jgi:hypothetical protein
MNELQGLRVRPLRAYFSAQDLVGAHHVREGLMQRLNLQLAAQLCAADRRRYGFVSTGNAAQKAALLNGQGISFGTHGGM